LRQAPTSRRAHARVPLVPRCPVAAGAEPAPDPLFVSGSGPKRTSICENAASAWLKLCKSLLCLWRG
jgi:hypothetical protein